MKLEMYYIGCRADWNQINHHCKRSVSKLNQRLSDELRASALMLGIKKTEQGKRLDFYEVDEIELSILLLTDCRPLVKVSSDSVEDICDRMSKVKEVSWEDDYTAFTEYHNRYKNEFVKTMKVIGKDLNLPPKKRDKAINPYKVGDLLYYSSRYSRDSKLARVSKVSKSSYWLEFAELSDNVDGFISIKDRLDVLKNDMGYKKVKTYYYDNWRWSLEIPYKSNKDKIFFYENENFNSAIRVRHSDVKYPCIIAEKDARYKEEMDLGWN